MASLSNQLAKTEGEDLREVSAVAAWQTERRAREKQLRSAAFFRRKRERERERDREPQKL